MKHITFGSACKTMSVLLAASLVFSGFSNPVGINSSERNLVNQSRKSVLNEIKKSSFSTKEQNEIKKSALVDGEATATKINAINDEKDFEAAVNYAMTAYYENEDFAEMADFEANIDIKSAEIVAGYKAAADERALGDSNGYEAGTVLLAFDSSSTEEEIQAVVEAEYGKCRDIYEYANGDYLVTVDISLGKTVDMAENAYNDYSIVEAASSNDYCAPTYETNDYVNDSLAKDQYYLDTMNVKKAWDYVTAYGHEKVLVGVIDTGAMLDHEDLDDVLSPLSAEVYDDKDPILLKDLRVPYDNAHGTQVAGVIAAEANNNTGIAGIASCYDNDVVQILAVKASQYYPEYNEFRLPFSRTAKAIDYCVRSGAKVINYSAGSNTPSGIIFNAIDAAVEAGAVFVASAGNDSNSSSFYPADYYNSISVLATNELTWLASFSNYGPSKDFAAPGVNVLSTSTSGYSYCHGTSFSSPAVAAVIAMMYSQNIAMNFDIVYDILARTSKDIGLAGKCQYGMIDAYAAVKAANEYGVVGELPTIQETTTEKITDTPTTVETSTSISDDFVNAGADWTNLSHWSVYFGGWAGNPIGMYKNGKSYNDFGLKIVNASTAEWGIQMKTQSIAVEAGQQYVCKVNATSNMASSTKIRFKDDKSGTEISKTLVSGVNTFELTFTASSEAQIFFDMGLAPAGLQFDITSFSLKKVGEEEASTEAPTTEVPTKEVPTTEIPTTEVPTTQEETTTISRETVVSTENIAKGKATYASSIENGDYASANITDGNMGSRWSSAWSDNEWIYVDLGSSYNVAKVKLFWEGAFASQFKIQVSTNATNWIDVATLGDSYCRDYEVSFAPVNARYVRMLGITRGTVYGYSLWEMEVYATDKVVDSVPQLPVLLSKNAAAYASTTESSTYSANLVTDDNTSTRWSSAWSDNEWIYVDLGSSKYIEYVDFIWEAAYAAEYQVQTSTDGVNWTTVNIVTNGAGGTETTSIGREARYVKMQGIRRGTIYGYSLFEINVYGY